MRTVVVLPTYNEAANIITMLERITASEIVPDVLVVDDSSPDDTGALVQRWATENPGRVRLLTRMAKEGLGAAYRAGFAEAIRLGYGRIVQMDADGSHPVEALARMAASLDAGHDVVLGSRYVPGGGVTADWAWHRKVLSRAGNAYARTVLGLPYRDLTGGFKMWRASMLARLDFGMATAAGYGFQIQTSIAALRSGASIVEVPILFSDRERGESKMSGAIVVEAMVAVLRMRGQLKSRHTGRSAEAAAVAR